MYAFTLTIYLKKKIYEKLKKWSNQLVTFHFFIKKFLKLFTNIYNLNHSSHLGFSTVNIVVPCNNINSFSFFLAFSLYIILFSFCFLLSMSFYFLYIYIYIYIY